MNDRVDRRFWLVDSDSVRHFPVRIRNRSSGRSAFRVSDAGNRLQDGQEIEDLDEVADLVVNRSYRVRAVPETDLRAAPSLVGLGKRKMISHGRAP